MCNSAVNHHHHHHHVYQRRIQELRKEGPHGERRAGAYNGGMGRKSPAGSRGRVPGQGSGWRCPLKLKASLALQHPKECENLALSNDFSAVFKVYNTVRTDPSPRVPERFQNGTAQARIEARKAECEVFGFGQRTLPQTSPPPGAASPLPKAKGSGERSKLPRRPQPKLNLLFWCILVKNLASGDSIIITSHLFAQVKPNMQYKTVNDF